MNKKDMIEIALNRGGELKLYNPEYLEEVKIFTSQLLKNDIGQGDITTDTLVKDVKCEAEIFSKQPGVIAGLEEAGWFLEENGIEYEKYKEDGDSIKESEPILILKGEKKNILKIERTLLNLLQRMSGIATLTNDLSKRLSIRIAATRKTHWGSLDNKAVHVGGGLTHRLGLWESFLIKDNHLSGMTIEEALDKVFEKKDLGVFVEIEAKDKEEVIKAAKKFKELDFDKPCIIMLDNISPEEIKNIVKELKEKELYDHVLLEASGRVNPINITVYDNIGVDFVSLGFLTHSPKAFDMSLKIK